MVVLGLGLAVLNLHSGAGFRPRVARRLAAEALPLALPLAAGKGAHNPSLGDPAPPPVGVVVCVVHWHPAYPLAPKVYPVRPDAGNLSGAHRHYITPRPRPRFGRGACGCLPAPLRPPAPPAARWTLALARRIPPPPALDAPLTVALHPSSFI